MATGNLIVDSLQSNQATGAAVAILAVNVAKAVNAVADVVTEEIAYRQELQQQTSVLLQKAGIQSLASAPIVGTATVTRVQTSQATVGKAVVTGVTNG